MAASRDSILVRRIAWAAAIAGIVPFAVATGAMLRGDSHIRIPAIAALVTLSAVVISSLGGIQVGLGVRGESSRDGVRALAIVLGGLTSLAAWAIPWLPSPQSQLGWALVLFVIVWIADLWLARAGLVPGWFMRLRTAVSAVVAVTLGIALYLL
ncbi:MAG TPA: DUF3429 domain-containing protein [Usitatibacter sp.]|jgi:uncharacterized protein DUF3429|nr:DUF3429 domain-containing protein [Usitatibacter sp.]